MILDQTKPRLKPCTIVDDGVRIILEDPKRRSPLTLPAERRSILALLDGSHSVRDIVAKLVSAGEAISFRSILSTLTLLDHNQMFEEPLGLAKAAKTSANPSERPEPFFMRPLFELSLIAHGKLSFLKNQWILYALTLAIGVVAVDSIVYWLSHSPTRGFLMRQGSYGLAAADLVFLCSLLMLCKGLGKAFALLLATGHFYNLRLRIHPFGLSLGVSDASAYAIGATPVLAAYFGVVALFYSFVAAVWPELFPNHPLLHSLETLAILFTFLELDPYRKSELTVLLDRFFKDDDQRHLTAYLKNRALLSAATASKGIKGETKLVLYSAAALAWTIAFFLFSIDALGSNYTNLLIAIQGGARIEQVSAALVLALLGVTLAGLVLDLGGTILRNLVFPALTPYLKLVKKVRSAEVKTFDRKIATERLSKLSVFQDFKPEALEQLVAASRMRKFKSGTRLIVQGEPGREMYVLLEGSVEVLKREATGLQTRVCRLGPDSVFGEIAILKDTVRTADVVANDDISVLIIEKKALESVLGQTGFKHDYDQLIDRIALGHYIASTALFRELPVETLGVFTRSGKLERRDSGQAVVREGEPGDSFFLVLRGELDVTKESALVSALKQGDFFGEIALLTARPRTATVTATSEVLLLSLSAEAFWQILSGNLELASALETVAKERLGTRL